jgi:large conductance mechanosensitive channel
MMWKEFKDFAFKGNVLDMAVGVIIGGAFGKIVTSIVNDIIMPLFGYVTSGSDFKTMKWTLSEAVIQGGAVVKPEAAIMYGNFIQNVVDFLIIAFSIFIFIRIINKAKAAKPSVQEEIKPEPKKGPTQEELLIEIRDLLKNKN